MKKAQAREGCVINNVEDIKRLFSEDPAEIKDRFAMVKKHISDIVDGILAVPSQERTFANTMKPLDDIERFTVIHAGPLLAESYVSTEKSIRDLCQMEYIGLAAFVQDKVSKNVSLYRACKEYFEHGYKPEEASLTNEERRFVKESMHDFERSGLSLPEEQLSTLKEVSNKINELSMKYERNIAESNKKIHVARDDLKGISDEFIKSLDKAEGGKFVLGTDYPTYHGIMQQCEVEGTRKKMYYLFNNRAYPENISVLNDVIEQRDKLAKLLGYESYAAYELDDRMVKKADRAYDFLQKLIPEANTKVEKELELLKKKLPESVQLVEGGKVKPWDMAFLKEQYKQEHFNLDQEKVAEYFPVDQALTEVFDIYQKFLGLRFEQKTVSGLWISPLRCIEVYRTSNNEKLGFLLLDLLPREGKYTHACHVTLVPAQKLADGTVCPALSMVIANFPKPTNGHQGLLKFDDVKTFFHEFGHAMHAMLGATQYATFAGTNVKRDFVEAPSQMFEEWFHDKELLNNISHHYKTGEPLPENMIDKLVNMSKFDAGDFILTQTFYSLLSLDFFGPGEKKDTEAILKKLYIEVMPYKAFDNMNHMQAAFGHLMGYGASYYGYLWSRVFALDLFSRVKEKGLLSTKAGEEFTAALLGQGGSDEPDNLLKNYLGREPNQEAFLEAYGLR